VRSVERALDILLCFARNEPVCSLTQIAERVGMSKATVHRLLATLEGKRFVTRDKVTGLYRLGFRFVEMASLVDKDLQQWARPYLQRLSEECGETVDLSVLDGSSVVYLYVVESLQRVKIAAVAGQRLPAFCTASGRALMAYLPKDQIEKILAEGFTRYTDRSPGSIEAVMESLRATRERGFAVSEKEYEKDINAVAAPILGIDNRPLAAIAIVGPSYRLTLERMLDLGESLKKSAETFAQEVGHTTLSTLSFKNQT
jgi:IclR family transcriptional regulator, acetate operon repressor